MLESSGLSRGEGSETGEALLDETDCCSSSEDV